MSRSTTTRHRFDAKKRPREWLINLLIFVAAVFVAQFWLRLLAELLNESLQRWVGL